MESETLYGMFAKAASIHSEEPAVTFDDGSGSAKSLSYRDLRALSAELCGILRQICLPTNEVIGLYCRENLILPVWILGIMQTPAAYAPLDPADPGLLSARVIKRCGLMHCAVQTELLEKFKHSLGEYLQLEVRLVLPKFKLTLVQVKSLQGDDEQDKLTEQAAPHPVGGAAELKNSFGYVLHTSGTTGLPKIVKVPHCCICPNIWYLSSLFQIKKGDVVFLASPLTFDPSVVEIFMALTSGAKLLIVPAVLKKMPKRLAQLLFTSHRITVLQATPTLFCRFGPNIVKEGVLSADSSLKVLVLGGEPCPTPEQLANWKNRDNKTEIFNIYGITEVSCWALCYRITQEELQSRQCTSVPIGDTLAGTVVEVRNEDGAVIKDGEGQVFIGGEHRVCLLDVEDTIVPGTMRATGDWVRVRDRRMYFLGRRDRMIKRHGQRVNLDTVQQLILSLPLVESCAVGLHENQRLIAFIVTSNAEDGTAIPVVVCEMREEQEDSRAGEVCKAVVKQLSEELASYSRPDTVVIVPELPLTAHGKVDMKALMKIYQMHRNGFQGGSQRDFTTENLESLWRASLGLSKDVPINEDSKFLLSGGDSLKALVFHEDVLNATGLTSPHLLELILDGTFSDIQRHLSENKRISPLHNDGQDKPEATKRHLKLSEVQAKRKRKIAEKETFKVMKRGSQMIERNRNKSGYLQTVGDVDLNETTVSLKMLWSSDTGRCVDASPVILVKQMGKKCTVFIGSHSHRIQALDLDSGRLVWERVLGDRIEASAAVSACGTFVIVGCYDGCVYFLDVSSGETEWVFKTGDAVKCCPAIDAETGLILVGSHDGHVYALDPKAQQCVWKRHCGGGAVFSSPFIHPSAGHLYVATLGGRLLCLNVDGGEVLWSYSRDAPFFSSPAGSETRIVIGSADGNICCFSVTGELIWQFLTQAPVFSSPCLTPDQQQLLCGSHDAHIYCLNVSDGSLLWSFETSGRVYSSPCVFALGTGRTVVGLASTDGTVWILDCKTGLKLASHTLPGELFSSPVIYRDSLVIGCRNDFVYCLKLQQK